MRPVPTSFVIIGRQVKSRHSTLFRLRAICGQQKGEEIKPGSILYRRPASNIRCFVFSPAIIGARKCIAVIHLRILKFLLASDGNPLHHRLRALAFRLVCRDDETPSHLKL
jgi:hypothetical protein